MIKSYIFNWLLHKYNIDTQMSESQLLQEIKDLKDKLQKAEDYIKELEIIKQKYIKNIQYDIDVMSGDMKEGPAKVQFTNMMYTMMY